MSDFTTRLTSALADRYTIDRELGAGGMATANLAQDLKHKRQVALEVLRPELAAVLGAERFEVWQGEWSPDGQWRVYRTGVPPTRDWFVKHNHPDSIGRTISASDAFQESLCE